MPENLENSAVATGLEKVSFLFVFNFFFLQYKYIYLFLESESEVTQSCPTLFDLMDCNPPGSSVHGISQARILEWFAISFSKKVTFHSNPKETQYQRMLKLLHTCTHLTL